ncbi:unnamed protein product [Sympodiomycopsis kandeliae]
MFALHRAFEQSTKSVEEAARAERERRGQLSQPTSPPSQNAFLDPMIGRRENHASRAPVSESQHTAAPDSGPQRTYIQRLPQLSPHIGHGSPPASPRTEGVPRQPGPPPACGLPPTPKDQSNPSTPKIGPSQSTSASRKASMNGDLGRVAKGAESDDLSTPRQKNINEESFRDRKLENSASDRQYLAEARSRSTLQEHAGGISFNMIRHPVGSSRPLVSASNFDDYQRPGTSSGSVISDSFGPAAPHTKWPEESSGRSDAVSSAIRPSPASETLVAKANSQPTRPTTGPRSSASGSRLKDMSRPFRRNKKKGEADSESDPSVALGSSPEPFGNRALERVSTESRNALSSMSHASTLNDEVSGTGTIRHQSATGARRMDPRSSSERHGSAAPDVVAHPRRNDSDAALGRTSGDSSSGGSSYQRRSLAFLANAISTRDSALGPVLGATGSIDEHQVPVPSNNSLSLAPVATEAAQSGQGDRINHLHLPPFHENGFNSQFRREPSVSPGTIPASSDYWSARPAQDAGAKPRRQRQDDEERRLIASLCASGQLDIVPDRRASDAEQGLPSGMSKSKSGSRIARAFSKRRPRTSISDLDTNRSLSPEAGFHRPSGSTTQGSMEGTRSSLSNEQQRARASVESTPFPTASPVPDASRLESSGGAAALFGGGPSSSSRPRTASLLPSLSMFGSTASRTKASPNASTTGFPKSASASNGALDKGPNSASPLETGSVSPVIKKSEAEAGGAARKAVKAPKFVPADGESAEDFAYRVEHFADPSEVASILASSSDKVFSDALHSHMQRFLFVGNPLDIALRKMLMELCLPKETQQIDRVMEAFAKRYNECNEGLYATEDQPYILAFSLMMLHTDAFNRNAKVKMTKADYVKNSSSSGVPQDILEYLYDNLTFTQFVYSNEDDAQRKAIENASSHGNSGSGFLSSKSNSSKDRSQKIDAYLLIKQGRLSQFQPAIENVIPEDDPYSYTGTSYTLNIPQLARAYASAPSIELAAHQSSPPPSGSNYNGQWSGPELASEAGGDETSVTLRVFKVGIVSRKDDVTDKSKKANRRWKPCGMILSSSQLLFFRDLVWVEALHAQIGEQLAEADPEERKRGILISPRISNFRPDGVLSLGDAIAVRDESYDKQNWVLRLIGVQGTLQHEYLFHTRDETDMNEWISGINFCACFRAFGVRATNLDAIALASALRDGNAPRNGSSVVTPRGGVATSPIPSPELLRARIQARKRELTPLLEEADKKLDAQASELAELLRLARHFAILTPFQRATRERIEAAAAPLAARIRQLRILVAKSECRRYILAAEMQHGEMSNGSPAAMSRETSQSGTDLTGPQTPVTPNLLADRKGSYFSNSDSGENVSLSPTAEGSHGLGLWPISAARDSGRTGGLGSVSEVSELEPGSSALSNHTPPIPTSTSIGSFASQAQGPPSSGGGSQPDTAISSSRSLKLRFGGKGKGKARQELPEPTDVAESWQSTRAFRDPDRISLAQLPSLEQIEAATREKARRRRYASSAGTSTSRSGALAYSGSSVSGSYRGGGSSSKRSAAGSTKAASTVGSSNRGSNKSGGRSASSSSSGKTNRVQNQPGDPPVFMYTWGS